MIKYYCPHCKTVIKECCYCVALGIKGNLMSGKNTRQRPKTGFKSDSHTRMPLWKLIKQVIKKEERNA